MPSERVTKALLSKSNLSEAEIEALTEAQAWRLLYANTGPKKPRDSRMQVCFTGFGVSQRKKLRNLAENGSLRVVGSVTRSLGLLVCGPNAGPKKLEKAAAQGVTVLDAAEFHEFLEAGKVPDTDLDS